MIFVLVLLFLPVPPLCPSSQSCPPSPSHLVGPGVFAQGSVLWNVNMRLCVKPEEPTFTGDKTPPTPGKGGGGQRVEGCGLKLEGDLKFNKAAK